MKKVLPFLLAILILPLLGLECKEKPPTPPTPPVPQVLEKEGWETVGQQIQVGTNLIYTEFKPEEPQTDPDMYPMSPGESRLVYEDASGKVLYVENFGEFSFGENELVNIDKDKEEELIFTTYSGGAHCCFTHYIFEVSPTSLTKTLQVDAGNHPFLYQDFNNDGTQEIILGDDSYAYRFTDYASSGIPKNIFEYQKGKLVNVNNKYPEFLENEIVFWKNAAQDMTKQYNSNCNEEMAPIRGPVSAVVAYYYYLGKETEAESYFNSVCGSGNQTLFQEMVEAAKESIKRNKVITSQ